LKRSCSIASLGSYGYTVYLFAEHFYFGHYVFLKEEKRLTVRRERKKRDIPRGMIAKMITNLM